jgi:hypothetical protein
MTKLQIIVFLNSSGAGANNLLLIAYAGYISLSEKRFKLPIHSTLNFRLRRSYRSIARLIGRTDSGRQSKVIRSSDREKE